MNKKLTRTMLAVFLVVMREESPDFYLHLLIKIGYIGYVERNEMIPLVKYN